MRSPGQYLALLRHLGTGWLLYRAGYAMRRKFGFLRRATPAMPWAVLPAPQLRLGCLSVPPAAIGEGCVAEAEAVLRGSFRLFSHRSVEAGASPDWHRNYLTEDCGQRAEDGRQRTEGEGRKTGAEGRRPEDRGQMGGLREGTRSARSANLSHWSEISDFGGDDIKGVWELNRFPWAFALARAHARTADVRYADCFWRLFADWCERNPPNSGPNWMCGQEASFRLFAVVFAAETLGVPPAHEALLARFVLATGRRIAANLGYALSQQNNHGVSECAGLLTAALLLPDEAASGRWRERALHALRRQLADLVYTDGGFAQHSLIYHRVLLHDLCWCRRVLRAHEADIPPWLDEAGRRALDFLGRLVDPTTGLAPLYGANDGANILPLSEGDFLDMRPVVQMASALFRRELALPAGPWGEAAGWMGRNVSDLPRGAWPWNEARWHGCESGMAGLRQGRSRLFMRCPPRFRHRPSQADMLHVDVWLKGRPVAHDGGSFSYNSPERFAQLGMAAHHNVLVVDEVEPLRKFSRFLHLPWPKGTVVVTPAGYTATHDGYDGLGVRWTRSVFVGSGEAFTVRDRVTGADGRRLRWHWRLADGPWQQVAGGVEMDAGGGSFRICWSGKVAVESRLVRAAPDSAWGWWSPHYGAVEPACSLLVEMVGESEVELTTEFIPLS